MTGVLAEPHNGRMGRKKLEGAKVFTVRLTPEDRAAAEAVQKAFGLPDVGSALRFAVRELVRRDRLKIDLPASQAEAEGE